MNKNSNKKNYKKTTAAAKKNKHTALHATLFAIVAVLLILVLQIILIQENLSVTSDMKMVIFSSMLRVPSRKVMLLLQQGMLLVPSFGHGISG